MEYRVKTYDGRRHTVTVGPKGFTVDGEKGNCLVLQEGAPLILAEVSGRLDSPAKEGSFNFQPILSYGKVAEILPVGVPAGA